MRHLVTIAAATALTALAGCVGYHTWPPADGQLASSNLDAPPASESMISALRWAIENNPPPEGVDVAINLPAAVEDETYTFIAEQVMKEVEGGVRPMSPGLEELPTFHVTRVWVRADKAEIDVLRPVVELGPSPTGRPIVQAVTVYLEGGVRHWRVERVQPWVIGADAIPPLHYQGVEDEPGDVESERDGTD